MPIELKASCKDKSNPLAIRKSARSFALATVEKQRRAFESWGVIGDWRNEARLYKTTNPDYVTNQLDRFHEMYQKGLIFRDLKPVYWSVSSKTALAEAELEYDANYKSPSLYFRAQINNFIDSNDIKYYALIWTTTPWTLPANQAISYNSDLKYVLVSLGIDTELYIVAESVLADLQKTLVGHDITVKKKISSDLSKLTYTHPVDAAQTLPFINGTHVSSSKGTGLVHTAPSHGFDDFLICLKHNITIKCIVDEDGNYTKDAPGNVHPSNVLENGNEKVLQLITPNVVHLGEITHSYPLDWRTKKPVFIRASHQWFINTDAIKGKAIEQLKDVQIFPQTSAAVNKQCLEDQLKKRPYWCISRQRVWGVPIPVFYHKVSGKILYNQEVLRRIQERISSEGNIDFWWTSDNTSQRQLLSGIVANPDNYTQGKDILDIWFDSGVSWSYALEGEKVANLYLEGIDQFTGWFQSSLMTSIAVREKAPYKSIFVHGFTVDSKGLKMSKSIGNIIEPKEIIENYGVDVLRWWVAAHSTQHSAIVVGDSILESSKEHVQKIRTVLKYLLGVLKTLKPSNENNKSQSLTHLDRFILAKTSEFESQVFAHYDSYQYNRVTATILNFIANDLSGVYLHLIKDRLYCGTQEEVNAIEWVIQRVTQSLLRTVWPINCHLVEEGFRYVSEEPFWKSTKEDYVQDNVARTSVDIIEKLLAVKKLVDKANVDKANSWNLRVSIKAPQEYEDIKVRFYSLLCY